MARFAMKPVRSGVEGARGAAVVMAMLLAALAAIIGATLLWQQQTGNQARGTRRK